MFLETCLKCPAGFPDVGTTTRTVYTVYYTFHLLRDWLVLYLHQYTFFVIVKLLEVKFLVDLSIFSLRPLIYGRTRNFLSFFSWMDLSDVTGGCTFFLWRHRVINCLGQPFERKAFCRWSDSDCKLVMAQCMGPVFEALHYPCFYPRNTEVLKVLSFLLTWTSRKAKDPLCSVSIVNWMDGLTEFIYWRKVSVPCGHTKVCFIKGHDL